MSETALATPSYLFLKLSQALFKKSPAALDAAERARVEQVARRQQAIEQCILASPEAAQVQVPTTSVDQALGEIRQRYRDIAEWHADMENAGLDEAGLRAAIARDLCFEAVLERIGSAEPKASDTDAEIFYLLHREKFKRPENRTLRHILVTINAALPGSDRFSAWRSIDAIRMRVKASPGSFAEEALKYSECPTAVNGGLLGTVRRGQLYAELEPVAFALPLGEVSDIVESPMGFHILYCVAIEDDSVVPFAVVRERIREQLNETRRSKAQKAWVKRQLGALPGSVF